MTPGEVIAHANRRTHCGAPECDVCRGKPVSAPVKSDRYWAIILDHVEQRLALLPAVSTEADAAVSLAQCNLLDELRAFIVGLTAAGHREFARVEGERVANTRNIDLWYPRSAGELLPDGRDTSVDAIVIGLVDVRAARDIRVRYDFDRDGYIIDADVTPQQDDPPPLQWAERAFIAAWDPGQ